MKSLKILLSVIMLFAFASAAMAASVTINYPGGSIPYNNYTVSNISQNSGSFTITLISASSNPPVCGNNVIETGEQCEPPGTATCSATCQTIGGTSPVCGNNVIEAGEQCEPPGTSTCSATCQNIASPPPPGGATDLGARGNNTVASLGSLGQAFYSIKLDANANKVTLNMVANDVSGANLDIIMSYKNQPKCSDIVGRSASGPDFWHGNGSTGNETLTMTAPTTRPTGSFVYATVCNKSLFAGKYKIWWTSY